eukprot:m.204015 g.204015  ORF g.204015 m.204015 type:complete len:67 (+) comp15524_c0_seq6:380-580(+)
MSHLATIALPNATLVQTPSRPALAQEQARAMGVTLSSIHPTISAYPQRHAAECHGAYRQGPALLGQ